MLRGETPTPLTYARFPDCRTAPETPLPRGSCKPTYVPVWKEPSRPEENPSSIRTRRFVLSPPPSWGCPVPQTRKITHPSLTPLKRGPFQLRATGDVVPGRQPDTWPFSLPALSPACCQQSTQCSCLVHLSGPTFHGSPQNAPFSLHQLETPCHKALTLLGHVFIDSIVHL